MAGLNLEAAAAKLEALPEAYTLTVTLDGETTVLTGADLSMTCHLPEDLRSAIGTKAEDIYDINQASLKDAVIGLGNEGSPFHHFCTGEIVSDQGLVITNHHCSFGMIQAHSSLEHNYLRDGFWAQSMADELVNPKITASILVRMEDV